MVQSTRGVVGFGASRYVQMLPRGRIPGPCSPAILLSSPDLGATMTQNLDCPIIAIEEHYWDAELASHFAGSEGSRSGRIEERLRDFGGERVADMNSAG